MSNTMKVSVAVLAIAAIIFVLFVLPPGEQAPTGPAMTSIQVLRPKVPINPGLEVTSPDLFYTEVISVPVSLADRYLTQFSPSELASQDTPWVVSRYLRAGQDVLAGDVVSPEQYRKVPDGDMEVISFPAQFDRVVAGQLWPGQLVNIYLYGPAKEIRDENLQLLSSEPQVELLADHVWVVDVRTANGQDTGYQNVTGNGAAASGTGTPAAADAGPFGMGMLSVTGSTTTGTEPASIITVAFSDTLKARRLVELMGSMGYRAWVSLSPREVINITPTASPTRTSTPTNTLRPTATPSNTPKPTATSTSTTVAVSVNVPATATARPTPTPFQVGNRPGAATPTALPCEYLLYGTDSFTIGGYSDNMDYHGANTFPRTQGMAQIHVDACQNRALDDPSISVWAELNVDAAHPLQLSATDSVQGMVRLVMTSIDQAQYSGGVFGDVESSNVYLSGDPNFTERYLPKSRTVLAAWGTGEIQVDGQTKYSGLKAFVMYTRQGFRVPMQVDGQTVYQVLTSAQECCYDPANPDDAYVGQEDTKMPRSVQETKSEDRELYFWFYSDQADTTNVPPQNLFVNLLFDNVSENRIPNTGVWLALPNTGVDREAEDEAQ